MARTIQVEFLENRVMFLPNIGRTFCNSARMKIINKDGQVSRDAQGEIRYRARKKYSILSSLHDEFVEKGIIENARD
jgi:hypothetical protein